MTIGLNAPDGAGCSLTIRLVREFRSDPRRLNAPDGAGCSLTAWIHAYMDDRVEVLMHLMVLGAP